jgi:hypothetical protein
VTEATVSVGPPSQEDEEHLRLLAIFHYVVAGMQFLFASFPVIHLAVGLAILFAPESFSSSKGEPSPKFIGLFFTLFAAAWMLVGYSLAACTVVAGRYLKQRRRRLFCLVVAGLMTAMCMPFGTVLGVFTIIVLMRPSVKTAFGE